MTQDSFVTAGGITYFAAGDGEHGAELWETDGTTTPQVSNINANFGSYPFQMAAAVGTLVTTDPDAGDTFTDTLVAGAGDSGNASFEAVDNTLRARAALNFERQSSLSIRVRVTDQGGLSLETPVTVQVTDVDEAPVVDHIVPPANGSHRAGQPLRFTAVTTQPVTRVGQGMPDIRLVVGRAAQKATLVGGLGTNRLTFQYVPTRGANDADGVTLGGTIRMPNGAFLRDAQGRRFSLAVPAAATGGVLVDTTAPLIRSLGRPAAGNPIVPTFLALPGRTVVLAPALAPAPSSAMLAAFSGLA